MTCRLPVGKQKNILSNVATRAPFQDVNLVNPWGLVADGCGKTLITANHGTGTVSLYSNGACRTFVFTVPGVNGAQGTPTGLTLNPTEEFPISSDGTSFPSQIILVSSDGNISGYHPSLNQNSAIVAVATGDILTGVAIRESLLYVANFSRGTLDVYSGTFQLLSRITDTELSALGYAPYNVANIRRPRKKKCTKEKIMVTFALRGPGNQVVPGCGWGYVDVLCKGELVRLIEGGALDAPWGLAGTKNYLFVGNSGDGLINVYDLKCGKFHGTLRTRCGDKLRIDGLWGIDMGRKNKKLYTASGPDHGTNGLVAKILFRKDKKHRKKK